MVDINHQIIYGTVYIYLHDNDMTITSVPPLKVFQIHYRIKQGVIEHISLLMWIELHFHQKLALV